MGKVVYPAQIGGLEELLGLLKMGDLLRCNRFRLLVRYLQRCGLVQLLITRRTSWFCVLGRCL